MDTRPAPAANDRDEAPSHVFSRRVAPVGIDAARTPPLGHPFSRSAHATAEWPRVATMQEPPATPGLTCWEFFLVTGVVLTALSMWLARSPSW
jgi:hypothetical protein